MSTNNFKDKDFFYPTSFANLNKKQVELFKLALSKNNPSANIAIMGPIGAGKSSFIRTFDNSDYNSIDEQPINFIKLLWGRLHRIIFHAPIKNNFVYISLADFDFLGRNHSEEAICKQVEAQLYEQLIIAVKESQRSFPYQWNDSSNYSRKRVGFIYIHQPPLSSTYFIINCSKFYRKYYIDYPFLNYFEPYIACFQWIPF